MTKEEEERIRKEMEYSAKWYNNKLKEINLLPFFRMIKGIEKDITGCSLEDVDLNDEEVMNKILKYNAAPVFRPNKKITQVYQVVYRVESFGKLYQTFVWDLIMNRVYPLPIFLRGTFRIFGEQKQHQAEVEPALA